MKAQFRHVCRVLACAVLVCTAQAQDLELAGGTFSGSGSITVSGNITNAGVTDTTMIVGRVTMNSSLSDQSIGTAGNGVIRFDSLTINTSGGASTTSTNVALAVSTALTIGGAQTFNIGAHALDIGGAFGAGGSLLTSSGSTVTFSGSSGSQVIRPATYADALVLSGNGTKEIAGAIAVGGTFAQSGGTLTINSGGALTLGTTGSFATVNNNGTLNGGSGTSSFSGTFTQNNVSALLSAGQGVLDFNGNLTNTSGTISLDAAEQLRVGGTFTNAGTLAFNASSTVEYDGGAQTLAAATYGNLTLSGVAAKVGSSNLTVAGTLTPTRGLAMDAGDTLEITASGTIGTFGALEEISGTVKVNPGAVGTFALNNASTSITFSGGFPSSYVMTVRPGTSPTGYVAGDMINRTVNVSFGTWSAGTASLTIGYRDTEVGGVQESHAKFFKDAVNVSNKFSGTYTRSLASGTTFGSITLAGMSFDAYASPTEIILSDLFNLFTSTQTGDWNNTSVWTEGSIPGSQDDVLISHAVTIPDNYSATAYTVKIDSAQSLTIGSTVDGPSASLSTAVGGNTLSLDVKGTFTVRQGHAAVIGGKLRNEGAIVNDGSITIQQ